MLTRAQLKAAGASVQKLASPLRSPKQAKRPKVDIAAPVPAATEAPKTVAVGQKTPPASPAKSLKPNGPRDPTESVKFFPENWKLQIENIREMRKDRNAVVDTMGSAKCADRDADPKDFRYQILLSLMLSSQTRDEVTSAAMARLREHGCTPQNILDTPIDTLGKLIYPVGFWKKKINYIREATNILVRKYGFDVPNTPEGLMALPGVGPKMAHLVMEHAWGKVTGIAVDTHVHRISNRLGWTPSWTREPEQTRKCLEDWLPKDLWAETNLLLVGFGQQICMPITPKCDRCLNKSICPFAKDERCSPKKK